MGSNWVHLKPTFGQCINISEFYKYHIYLYNVYAVLYTWIFMYMQYSVHIIFTCNLSIPIFVHMYMYSCSKLKYIIFTWICSLVYVPYMYLYIHCLLILFPDSAVVCLQQSVSHRHPWYRVVYHGLPPRESCRHQQIW